jgi:hypothetical protein
VDRLDNLAIEPGYRATSGDTLDKLTVQLAKSSTVVKKLSKRLWMLLGTSKELGKVSLYPPSSTTHHTPRRISPTEPLNESPSVGTLGSTVKEPPYRATSAGILGRVTINLANLFAVAEKLTR